MSNEIIDNKDIEFIKNLSYEIKTQDKRATAEPYALVLEEEVERVVSNESEFDNQTCVWNDVEYENWDDFTDSLKECYGYGSEAFERHEIAEMLEEIFNMNNFDELLDSSYEKVLDARIIAVRREQGINERTVNSLLTEKAYDEHIKINGHNLKNPSSFGIHLFRNAEMAQVISIIHKLANSFEKEGD